MSTPADNAAVAADQEERPTIVRHEARRRREIRAAFDEIESLLPTLGGFRRSEQVLLQAAVAYIEALLAQRHRLMEALHARGVDVTAFEIDIPTMAMAAVLALEEDSE